MRASSVTRAEATKSHSAWKTLPQALLWAVLIGLAISNLMLLRQNREMRAKLGNEKPNFIKRGDKLPQFSAVGLRGEAFKISYTGRILLTKMLSWLPKLRHFRFFSAYDKLVHLKPGIAVLPCTSEGA
jgi:hypothetical protein